MDDEILFKQFVEAVAEGVGWAALDGTLQYVNQALAEILGLESPKDAVGVVVLEFYDDQTQRRLTEEIFPSILAEGTWVGELTVVSRKQERIPTLNRLFVLRDAEGTPTSFANIVSDLREQKRAEEELEQHRNHLEELVAQRTGELERSNSLLAAQRDLALRLGHVGRLEETLEAGLEEVLRITAMDAGGIYLVDEASGNLDLVASRGLSPAFLETGTHYAATSRHTQAVMLGELLFIGPDDLDELLTETQRKDGLQCTAAIPVQNEGRVIACLNIASHVHDDIAPDLRAMLAAVTAQLGSAIARAQAQELLLRSEERYRNFVTNASEGIYRIDFERPVPIDLPDDELKRQIARHAVVGEVNDALARMYGLRPVEMEGRLATDFAPDYGVRGALVLRAKNHQIIEMEAADLDAQGQAIYLAESYTGIVEQGQLIRIWGMRRNITERRRAEEGRQRLQEQLQQAQKMEAIGRLAGGVAHDFNNIMTGINGFTELLLEAVEPGDPLRSDLEEILRAGERAAELTNQLLAFSRKQVIAPRVISPNEVLERSRKMLRRIIGEDIDLAFRPARGVGRIKADPAQLDQVLVNLAVNARDAMPDGGQLTIETNNVDLDEAYCKGRDDCRAGHFVMLAVSDAGCGMDEETRTQIFEPFFTTKQNNGFINVYSEPEIGTTFKIYLPRVFEEVERIDSAERLHPRGSETVLLVEDEEMVRKLARRILERQGYTVIEASDGGAAYLACTKHEGPLHLLLTDVVMPSMNGRELYEKLQEQRPELKVLYMSGYTANVIAHHGVLEEGTDFLQKPFTVKSMTHKVRQVLGG
jgi:PAS domain S-box-containing protein